MQSLIVIACKILRVIFIILTKGTTYDPKKLLGDIVRPDPGRVLEKKPVKQMECGVHYISTKTN